MQLCKRIGAVVLCLAMALGLSGCMIPATDQLFSLPKRSQAYEDLQKAIDGVLPGYYYCAPTHGENQQTLQMADLDGDGADEALLFAKGTGENPLTIFIFDEEDQGYALTARLSGAGSAYDQVEYAQLDGTGGLELIVGRGLSGEVPLALTVYSFDGDCRESSLLTTSCARFLTLNSRDNGLDELFILAQNGRTGKGTASLYSWNGEALACSGSAFMSVPVENICRIALGNLCEDTPAIFVASDYEEDTILTDVFASLDGGLTNVSLDSESGISTETIRNYCVYAGDIDGDGLMELPSPIPLRSTEEGEPQFLIRWFNLDRQGNRIDKLTTYHNFTELWYVVLDEAWIENACVLPGVTGSGTSYIFGQWDESGTVEKLFTIYAFTGEDREERAADPGLFEIGRKGETIFCGSLGAEELTQEDVTSRFQFMKIAWKTGET